MARLSPSYVTKVESGEIAPSLGAFASLVVALGLSPQEVFLLVLAEAYRRVEEVG